MVLKQIVADCRDRMAKSVQYYEKELRGIRTGRATTALIDYVKIEYYGSHTDLREIAQVTVPEPTQLVVKPFDPGSKNDIIKAIETADLGLNPMTDGAVIRINVPPPSAERRKQLVGQVRKLGEDSKVAVRNERRDANKQIDAAVKDKSVQVSEDQGHDARDEVDQLAKQHVDRIEEICNRKAQEVEEI
ncbi:MAG: ribosome recycling factor [Planctomycetota bacterium]|jgi:ribosome recycling factor